MNLKEVEIVMSPEELLELLWWHEGSSKKVISSDINGLPEHWQVKSLYFNEARVGSAKEAR